MADGHGDHPLDPESRVDTCLKPSNASLYVTPVPSVRDIRTCHLARECAVSVSYPLTASTPTARGSSMPAAYHKTPTARPMPIGLWVTANVAPATTIIPQHHRMVISASSPPMI